MEYILDIFVVLFIFLGVILGHIKGIRMTFLHIIKIVLASLGTYFIYPIFGNFLKDFTPLFSILKQSIGKTLDLRQISFYDDLKVQRDFIEEILASKWIKKEIIYYNNREIHHIFEAQDTTEYIYGYFANLILNVSIILLLFLFLFIGIHYIFKYIKYFSAEDLSQNQYIKILSSVLGGFIGYFYLQGLQFFLIFCYAYAKGYEFLIWSSSSKVFSFLYDKNILIHFITKINI